MRGIIGVLNELYIRFMVWLGAAPPSGYEHLIPDEGEVREYTVKEGDTLFAVARTVGVHYDRIAKANAIDDPNNIQPGQKLIIPPTDWDPASGPLVQPTELEVEPEPLAPTPAPVEMVESDQEPLAPPAEAAPPAKIEETAGPVPQPPKEGAPEKLAWPVQKPQERPEEAVPPETEEPDWLAEEFPSPEQEPDWLAEAAAPPLEETEKAPEARPEPESGGEPAERTLEIEPAAQDILPTPSEAPTEVETAPPVVPEPGEELPDREAFRYTVQRGDTLNGIARRYGLTVRDLVDANDIVNPNLIFPGQKIIIPGYSIPSPPEPPAPAPPTSPPIDQFIVHNVVRGDTISAIAKRYGITVRQLIEANQISDSGHIQVGQQLVIPGVVAPPPEIPAAAAEPERVITPAIGIDSEFPPVGPIEAIRGLYVSYFAIGHSEFRQHVLELLDKTELNAVVIDAKGDHGWISYPSHIALAHEIGAARPSAKDFETVMEQIKKRSIYTIARIVTFKDNLLARSYPEYAVKTNDRNEAVELWQDSDQMGWTDPFLKPVWDYNIQIAKEAAQMGFDEIQFDYVRFPTPSQVGPPQFSQEATKDTRVAAITSFLSAARGQIKLFGVKIAADVFGYTCWRKDDTLIGQDIDRMGQYLDVLSPMLYPSTFGSGIPGYKFAVAHPYEVVYESARRAVDRVAQFNCIVRPWIQDFPDHRFDKRAYGRAEIQAQIKGCFDGGSSGFMAWDPGVRYTDGAYAPVKTRPS